MVARPPGRQTILSVTIHDLHPNRERLREFACRQNKAEQHIGLPVNSGRIVAGIYRGQPVECRGSEGWRLVKKRNPLPLTEGGQGGKENQLATETLSHTAAPGQLWPATVTLLQKRGVTFEWDAIGNVIRLRCPCCPSGRLLCDPEKPWFWHVGEKGCAVARMKKFNDLLFYLK